MAKVQHDLTDAPWAWPTEAWTGCAYCGATGRPLQKDCQGNTEVTARLRRKKLDETAFLVRQAQISRAATVEGSRTQQ